MSNKIDWLSISLPLKSIISLNFDTGKYEFPGAVRDEYPQLCDWCSSYPDWIEGGGNRIFNRKIRSKTGGFTIFWNPDKNFSLVEFSGTGVQELREQSMLFPIVKSYGEFLTRIDLATDWETEVSPKEFAECREIGRFTTYTDMSSETGDTYYVGSWKSDRYAKIYRYSEPHPRHPFLRREYVLRGEYAKAAASDLQSMRIREYLSNLDQTFGFNHRLSLKSETSKKVNAPTRGSKMGSTERWLFSQVLPACKKLIDDGNTEIIDIFGRQLYDYFDQHLTAKDTSYGQATILPDLELPGEQNL